MEWEWRDWSLASLKGVEPYEVVQALNTGRMVRRWVNEEVLAVLSSTATGRVLVIALYEENDSWVLIGARPATPEEALTYRNAIEWGTA